MAIEFYNKAFGQKLIYSLYLTQDISQKQVCWNFVPTNSTPPTPLPFKSNANSVYCLKCFKKAIGGGIYTTIFVVLF